MGTITENNVGAATLLDVVREGDDPIKGDNNGSAAATSLPIWAVTEKFVPAILRPTALSGPPRQHPVPKQQIAAALPSHTLRAAKQIVAVGWSSMGLGHTGRVFAPVLAAARDGTLAAGDVVIVHVPRPWGDEQKQLSANKTLNHFRETLEKKGIKVAFLRADKTVRADYLGANSVLGKPGHSNNVAAMASFALQPYRVVPPAARIDWDDLFTRTAALGDTLNQSALETLPVATAGDVINQLKASAASCEIADANAKLKEPMEANDSRVTPDANPPPTIAVLTDMDPYLADAAVKAGVRSVSQSNHANLFTLAEDDSPRARRTAMQANRTLFIWSKMEYGAEHGHVHAEISTDRNPLSGFKSTASAMKDDFNVAADTSKMDSRNAVCKKFLETGNRIDQPAGEYNGEPGIFVGNEEPENIVLLYVQGLTKDYGRHILAKMEARDPAYSKTMFVVCAPGSFTDGCNAFQVGMFANAGIVMAGGFGTTSEAWYALEHGDYQGLINIRPVPFQREQETNACRMREHFSASAETGDRVTVSSDDDWADLLDTMVAKGVAQPLTGDMRQFFKAIEAEGTNAEHTKKLLFEQEAPTLKERRMNSALAASRKDNVTKANFRLMTKVIVPTLCTIATNGGALDQPFHCKMTSKDDIHQFNDIDDLIATLRDKVRLSKLLGIELDDADIGIYKNDFVDALVKMKSKQPHVRAMDAELLLRQLNEGVSAGS